MKKSLIKLAGSVSLLALSASPAFAQTISVSQLSNVGVSSIGRLISAVFTAAIVIAVLFVFFMLLQGGYAWITAGGDKGKVEEARTRITNALIGLAIVASAFAIISLVSQFFGVDFSNISLPSAANNSVIQN